MRNNAFPILFLANSPLLRGAFATYATECNAGKVNVISQAELSPSFKYIKSAGRTEIRRIVLNTPPGKHVLTTGTKLSTAPKILKPGAGRDYLGNIHPANVVHTSDDSISVDSKEAVKYVLSLESTADLSKMCSPMNKMRIISFVGGK